MSRISRVAIAILVALLISAGVLVKLEGPALAQSAPSRSAGLTVHTEATHPTAAPVTPPPLPFGNQRATSANAVQHSGKHIVLPFSLQPVPALPAKFRARAPKLSQVLRDVKSGRRHISAANGATIVLTGEGKFFEVNDQTEPYGANVFYLCENMQPNTSYSYVLFPPNNGRLTGAGTGEQPKTAAFTTTAQGQCGSAGGGGDNYDGNNGILLQTPFNQGGAVDPPYPSVWTVAMLNNATNQFEAVSFTVVLATLHFNTFADAGFTTLGKDYTPGSTVFMQATGLTPSHEYAFGVVNTSIAPLPCVFTQPAASQNFADATCFNDGVVTGVIPTNGTFSGSWTTPANESTGTYSVELYDVTSQDLVSTQQISIAPAANAMTLTPLNGATAGVNLGDTFATDGIVTVNGALTQEQSVTGFLFSVSGLTANDTYAMTISTPNGVVLTNSPAGGGAVANPSINNQILAPPLTVKPATTSITNQAFQFPVDSRAVSPTQNAVAGTFTGIGPTFTSFASNVMTLQLFDQTKGVVAASKAFYVVAYQAQFKWTSPAGSSVTVAAAGTNVQATVTNSAGTSFGTWNGDGLKSIVFAPDTGGNITLALDGATATDSTGQTWNIALNAGDIVATPQTPGQFLANNATLIVPLNVKVPVGRCLTAVCTLQTAITPVHGVAQSGFDVATNGLGVFGPGASAVAASSTSQLQVTAGPGGALGVGAPRYPQLMYVSGTDGVTTGNYTVQLNLVNCGSSTQNIMEFDVTLPTSFDANLTAFAPTMSNVTVGGANQTADWKLCTAANNNCNGTNRVNVLHENQFSIVCTGPGSDTKQNGCGIPFTSATGCTTGALTTASTGVFTLSWPIPALAFPLQEVTMTGNYQGGCAVTPPTTCSNGGNLTTFQLEPIQQLTNTVNGPSNVDSTELGVYSLNSTLMTGVMNPSTVGQGVAVTTQFQFTNTSTSAGEPNPDSVDEITLTLPTADAPNTITPPANWFLNSQATAGANTTFTFSVCNGAVPPCGKTPPTFPGGDEPNAVPPGGSANFTFNYSAAPFPAAGTATITWTAFGANGGAAAVSQTTTLLFANTIATLAFIDAGGGVDGLPQIPVVGGQPTIGSDAEDLDKLGNQFVLQLTNSGTQTITGATIAIPALDTNGDAMQDTTHDWQITNVATAGGGCGAPTVTLPKEATATRGSIVLAGCSLTPGASMTISFDSQAPYDLSGHIYSFGPGSTVTSAVTANAAITTTAGNPQSDTMLVVSDAQLDIFIPTASNSIPNGNGGTFTGGSCVGCTFTAAGAAVGTTPGSLAVINLGTFAGTFTGNDLVNAAVTSDTEGAHGWTLFVSNSAQTSGTVSGTVNGSLDSTTFTANGAFTASLTQNATFTQLSTANPGTQVSNFAGQTAANAFTHAAVPNVMNFQITLPAPVVTGTQTVTLLYTLIPN